VRSEIPAVTHVDYSARIQTVHANKNPVFHRLLKRFKELRCFMGNELDLLVIGNCILQKAKQDEALKQDYSAVFDLD
jgi:carbamoyltransferase